jgi:ubiquinone/menaquinone biosynthesis C-methylase UbiE
MPEHGPDPGRDWALALFRRSLLKQRKLAEILALLGPSHGLRCLDLGSDNGVVSLLLREQGGEWSSGDLTSEAVASIRSLVGGEAHLVQGDRLPFPDHSVDRVVVVDMLEHVADEAAFVLELARVIRPGGRLVVNTPHLKRTTLRRLRRALGQTDQKHGHLRPGYSVARLRELLAPHFELERQRTYSRFFSEALDTALNWGMERLGKKSSAKGMVVTRDDLARHRRLLRVYSALYPLAWIMTRLDLLVPASGYMLIVSARRSQT